MSADEVSELLGRAQVPITGAAPINVDIRMGDVIFLLGANGAGKSSLIHRLKQPFGQRAVYLPGSRPSYFDHDSLSMTAASRKQIMVSLTHHDSLPDARWQAATGTARNEKAVHDLQSAELGYDVSITRDIKAQGESSPAIKRLLSRSSPLDKVNSLLQQANLSVRLIMDGSELKACRGPAVYSFARMSDGERTALLFAAEVVSAATASVFVVDEPELHLHRSIIVPLLKALIGERNDCAFIISTHELSLPGEVPDAGALLVRGCEWSGDAVASWSIDRIADLATLPEDFRIDILGSRKKMLFVEGTEAGRSLDFPLFSLLYPQVSVIAKENCKEVHRCVTGMVATQCEHHATAYGMVDQDGMNAGQAADLKAQGVYPLPIFSVESLYYCSDVLAAVAEQQASTLGQEPLALLLGAKRRALQTIDDESLAHLASRRAERKLRDQLQFAVPTREEIIAGSRMEVAVASPYPMELAKIKALVEAGNIDAVVQGYPVRESQVLTALAKGLRFQDRGDYEKAALARVTASESLRQKMRDSLGEISALIG